jgi:hypothetical protein
MNARSQKEPHEGVTISTTCGKCDLAKVGGVITVAVMVVFFG